MNAEFPLYQMHVANRLGISEERVREMRGMLEEGTHWIKKGPRLLFSLEAVTRLAQELGVPEMPPVPIVPPLLEWPAIHRLVVVKVWPSPYYVQGALIFGQDGIGFAPVPPNAQLLRIRVKTNQNLSRGVVLECVHVGADLYEAVKLPRRKGRW